MQGGASSRILRKLRVGCFLHGKRGKARWQEKWGSGWVVWRGYPVYPYIQPILIQTRGGGR